MPRSSSCLGEFRGRRRLGRYQMQLAPRLNQEFLQVGVGRFEQRLLPALEVTFTLT
jgi:hypothetical protein